VTAIVYSQSAAHDLERLADFLRESDPHAALATSTLIMESIGLLAQHPLIGRSLGGNRRELVMFRGRSGYLARYTFSAARDAVLVLSIRHHRELDS